MEALQDISWIRYLYTSVQREHFRWNGFRVVTIMVPSSSLHHHERFRYRMLVFEAATIKPVMAINIEDDLMGSWCLTLQQASSLEVLQRMDAAPGYDVFRELALDQLEQQLGKRPKTVARPSRREQPAVQTGAKKPVPANRKPGTRATKNRTMLPGEASSQEAVPPGKILRFP